MNSGVCRVIVVAFLLPLSTTHLAFGQITDGRLFTPRLAACEVTDASFPPSRLTIAQAKVSPEESRPTARKFFDATTIALTVAESAALIADGVYTQRLLTRYPNWGHEADPLARPFVNAGWPGQIAGGVLVVSADVALRYLLHRKGHHRLERLLPLILIAYGTAGAIHNARVLRDIERGR